MRIALMVGLLGCGAAPTPPPTPPPIVTEPPLDPSCTSAGDPQPFDHATTIEIAICTTSTRPDPAGSEMRYAERKALLILHGSQRAPYLLGTWEDGWEDGGFWELEGVLHGDDRAAVIAIENHHNLDSGQNIAHVLVLDRAEWSEVYTSSGGSAAVAVSSDGQVATITSTTAQVELRWRDGRVVETKR